MSAEPVDAPGSQQMGVSGQLRVSGQVGISGQVGDADRRLAAALMALPGTVAVLLGGSRATGLADAASDTDLYALHAGPIPSPEQRIDAVGAVHGAEAVLTDDTFGPETHLHLDGRLVEVMHLSVDDLTQMVDTAFGPGIGGQVCSTAFLHTLAVGVPIVDADGVASLRARLARYPEPTRGRILRECLPAMVEQVRQLRSAQARGDLLMVTDRRAAVQAAWFNALFALNQRFHPGEKRLLRHAARLPLRPERMIGRWADAVQLAPDDPALPDALGALVSDLTLLVPMGLLIPPGAR